MHAAGATPSKNKEDEKTLEHEMKEIKEFKKAISKHQSEAAIKFALPCKKLSGGAGKKPSKMVSDSKLPRVLPKLKEFYTRKDLINNSFKQRLKKRLAM